MKLILNLFEVFGLILTTAGVVGENRLTIFELNLRKAIKWTSGIIFLRKFEHYLISKFAKRFDDGFEYLRKNWILSLTIILVIIVNAFLILTNPFNHFLESYGLNIYLGLAGLTILVLVILTFLVFPVWAPGQIKISRGLGFLFLLSIILVLLLVIPITFVLFIFPVIIFLIINALKLILIMIWGVIWLMIKPYALIDFISNLLHLRSTIVIVGLIISICAILLKN